MLQFIGNAGFSPDYNKELCGIFSVLPDIFRISKKHLDIRKMILRTYLELLGKISDNTT